MKLRDVMIPPGYASMDEALERARQKWPGEQEPRLQGLLRHGLIAGATVATDGETLSLEAAVWSTDRGLRALVTGLYSENDHAAPTHRAVVSEADLDAQLPTMAQQMAKTADERRLRRQMIISPPVAPADTKARAKPGPKTTYDEAAFLIEAFCLLYDRNKPPRSQDELVNAALTAYQLAGLPGGMPSTSWAKPKISKLWKRLFAEG